ncbi:MAG: PAS domain S-box protein, partial [Povalibacter sp.]
MNDTRAPLGTAAAPFVATSVATSTIASVLLVDDQPAKLLSYEAILGDLQLRCVRAYSGREALKQLLLQEFAAIVLDVSMPDMDGFETARMIREHPRLERTPIIFVTGINVSEFDQLKGYEVGAIDYIAVPVIPEILRSKIAVLVELHQRRSALQAVNKSLAEARAELESRHASVIAQREAEHEAIFEHPSHVNAVIEVVRDSDGKIRDWRYRNANRSAAALVGLQREQIIGRCIGQVLPPPRVAHVAACYAQVLASGQIARYEMTYGSADYLVTVYRMNAECIVTSGIDITDRKNAEAGMRRSEARYQALLENAPVAVAHNALDGRFEYVNRAFCKLVGYSADELLQKRWQDITHPEDIESDSSLARRVLAGELPDYTIEKRYVRKDGEIVWVNLFGNFVHDSNDRAVQGVAVAIDITEQRRAAADLVESRERLVLAKAAARLGTHDWDIRTGIIKWDERTYELWDLQPGTPVTFETFAQGLHPDDFATMQAAVDRALDPNGDGKYLSVYRVIRRRDGSTCWIEATGRVTFENGKPVRLVGTVQDITERTLAQSQLRSSEERFRELANNIDQFAWTCDEHGQAFWYNDRWYEYTGTREQDMLGLAWSTLHHPDHLERVKTHLEYCLRTGTPWEDTFPLRGKDGNYRWFLSRAVPIRGDDGKVLRWFGTNTDVTDLRGLQEELKQADALKDEFLAMLSHELRNPTAAISNAAQVLSRLLAD